VTVTLSDLLAAIEERLTGKIRETVRRFVLSRPAGDILRQIEAARYLAGEVRDPAARASLVERFLVRAARSRGVELSSLQAVVLRDLVLNLKVAG
jgi:hypothetical protein